MRSQEPRAAQNPAYRLTRIRFESLTKRHSASPRAFLPSLRIADNSRVDLSLPAASSKGLQSSLSLFQITKRNES
jgi:hypothetical protein